MATRGSDGSVEMKITGDTSPLEATVAAAKAKIDADGASGKVGGASTKAAADVAKVGVAAAASTEALNKMGQAGSNAVGDSSNTASGLKSLNKTLGDTVGQVQNLFAKLTMVVGVATGFFALGRAIRESVTEELKTGTEKAQEFLDAMTSTEPRKRIAEVDEELKKVNQDLANAVENASKLTDVDFKGAFNEGPESRFGGVKNAFRDAQREVQRLKDQQKALLDASKNDRALVESLDAKTADARLEKAIDSYRKELNARIDASAEYNSRVDKALEDETDARDRQIADFRESMKDLGDEMTKQAKRSQDAWVDSLRAIREESNRAFNTDQAASMVQLAGNLRTTATIATSNMNRIVVGGDD